MSREIKFRGFSEELKRFVYGFFQEVEAEGVGYSYIFWQGHTTSVRADSVSQFTGLYDKSLKEIYEDDIVKTKYQELAKIIWHKEYACFCFETIDEIVKKEIQFSFRPSEIEIIGNVFDNPNLLQ